MLTPQEAFPKSKLLDYDKLAHLGVFAIFSITLLISARIDSKEGRLSSKTKKKALSICIVYGLILESLQYFVPGRMVDIYDLLANTLGAIVGVILFSTFIKN